MNVKSGVALEHKGKAKAGPERVAVDGCMTRNEYLVHSRREISGDTQMQFSQSGGVRAVGGNSGTSPDVSPKVGAAQDATPKGLGASQDMTGSSPAAKSDSLPAIDKGRPSPQAGDASASKSPAGVGGSAGMSPGDSPNPPEMVASPTAPPYYTRGRKFDSVGHLGCPPRTRVPGLGKIDAYSSASRSTQPPLGATMGHGLLRHQSLMEEFFFPPNPLNGGSGSPSSARLGPRCQSAADLPTARQQALANGLFQGMSPKHGNIVPEDSSTAYQHIRKQLFADPLPAVAPRSLVTTPGGLSGAT